MKIRSLLHQVRWLPILVKDILLNPTYRPRDFWERRHRGADDFWAVGSRGRDKEGNLAWYAQQEQDLLDEMHQLQLDLRQMSVLEIGSGRGYFTAIVQRLGCKEYLGIEIADSAVRRLRSKFPEFRFQTGDVPQNPIEGKWDLILMMNVDMHIHGVDFIKAMNAIKHAMKSTSWFLVSTSRPGKKSSVFYVEYHSEADFAKIFPPGWIRRPVHKYADEVLLSISESNAS